MSASYFFNPPYFTVNLIKGNSLYTKSVITVKVENMSDTKYQITEKIEGEILGVRQVQDHGRIQVPKIIRDILQLNDGDNAYWIKDKEGKIVLRKAGKI